MDEELARIADALEKIVPLLEVIAKKTPQSAKENIPYKKPSKSKNKISSKEKKCRKCGKLGKLYLGGHGLGECCRPAKKSRVKSLPRTRKKTKGVVKAQASAPATERAERQRSVPIPVKSAPPAPREVLQATSRDELVAVQDMLASFVYSMRDRNVGEKEILWEITHRAAGKGITLSDAQASDIYSKILQNPRPC